MSESDPSRELVESLHEQAFEAQSFARTVLAGTLAYEDGVLEKSQLNDLIESTSDDGMIPSECYPGDEYFDRAQTKLENRY
ncbi:hypothetical protein [Natrinema versiforme]|uniref:Uncharacterized protein n=1 Tax=Natrinema versiforme JCM 10478 TaxID=1227496 RepID=L9Y495_9EURY|nr:hypothetical protein [Natrinema versiforme]ELY68890.1 hypothetical protein C489_05973 [Natrinema versiforme JCM 10478]